MGDISKANSLSDVLNKLFMGKTVGGELTVVAEEQLILTREPCPEILSRVNSMPDIILVQKYSQHSKRLLSVEEQVKQANSLNSINSSTPTSKRILSDDLDVTGSPLKCPFDVDTAFSDLSPFSISLPPCKKMKKTSLSYTPVSASIAGLIASKFNLALKQLPNDESRQIPLWIVCDGKDSQGTLFFGVHCKDERAVRCMITSSGPFNNFDSLTLDHLKLHHLAAGLTKRVDTSVNATYHVLLSKDDSEYSSIELACSWKRAVKILQPPSLDAHTTANLKVVCSDPRSAAYQMCQELSILKGFVSGLSSGEVLWFIREDSSSVSEDIELVFKTIREKAQRQKRDEDGSSDFGKMVQDKFCSHRQNMDFTDLLWSVLMRCESYSDLKENLDLVFKTIATGQVRPQIHVRNKTQIGILSRSLMRGQAELPSLSGITPLQMLIEIGIEKIKRDYINIFQAGELVTGDQLSWFVNNDDDSTENVVALLEKMHVGLQVVVILHTYLGLPSSSLAHFTAQALNQLKEAEDDALYDFNFKLETHTVHQLLNSLTPASWEVILESSHESYSKSLICHISRNPLINFGSTNTGFEDLLEDNDKDGTQEEEDKFYCCFFTTVKDKIFL